MDFTGNLYFTGSAAPPGAPPRPASLAVNPRAPVVSTSGVEPFLAWLTWQSGLDATRYRPLVLARRIHACLRRLRVATVDEAEALLRAKPSLIEPAVETLLLGVTEFFRDAPVFAYLQRQVLPELLARAARVRIWSAACSDGRELYSVAMLLADRGWLTRADMVGSDCRREAVVRAQAAIYRADELAEAGDPARFQHAVTIGRGDVQIDERLRAATRWRVSDLLTDTQPGPWDLILWRNMAIYLTETAAADVWERLAAELRPGGYLMVGRAERPPRRLGLVRISSCLYQKALDE